MGMVLCLWFRDLVILFSQWEIRPCYVYLWLFFHWDIRLFIVYNNTCGCYFHWGIRLCNVYLWLQVKGSRQHKITGSSVQGNKAVNTCKTRPISGNALWHIPEGGRGTGWSWSLTARCGRIVEADREPSQTGWLTAITCRIWCKIAYSSLWIKVRRRRWCATETHSVTYEGIWVYPQQTQLRESMSNRSGLLV